MMLPQRFLIDLFSRSRRILPIANVILFTLAFAIFAFSQGKASEQPASDSALSWAVCPIVYPDDQFPAARGYHYTFFGNAFFINDQGYLLTVAHVLETFHDGGQPYILVARPNAPPRILKVEIVAADPTHDIAILRANPNPFSAKYSVAALQLTSQPPVRGQSVLAVSLHPARLQDAHSFEAPRQDLSSGEILSFESTKLDKSSPNAEVFLLSHPVVRGQSGSPVIATESHAVVGLVEGRWLRSGSASLSVLAPSSSNSSNSVPGAAVPIRYAIALLDQHNIPWHLPNNPPPVSASQSLPAD